MFDKNDPLIGAVQKVMQANAAEREAVKAVNEKFGVQDRKVLPHEKQSEWDTAYKAVLAEGVESIEEMSLKQRMLARVGAKVNRKDNPKTIGKDDLEGARQGHASHIREDETPMTKMGIKKPDYAPEGETPDYAKSKEQTPNRTAKTSLPAGTLKKAIKENSITSIQEEISYNLAEEAFGIYENNGTQDFVDYIDSLNEEQLELLGMNEEFMQFVINEGLWDSISAGARGAWDSATLGAGKYVSGAVRHGYAKIKGEKSNYMDQVDKEDQANQKAEKDNPTAYNTGYVGGVAASLLTPGGLAAQGAKLAGKAALKAGAKSLAKSTGKVTAGTVAVDQVDNARKSRNNTAPAMNEDVEIAMFREELANHLYENFSIGEINSLTEEDLNNIVNEGNFVSNYISKTVSPLVSKAVSATTNYLSKKAAPAAAASAAPATTKKAAQASVSTVKKQAAKSAANRYNVAGAAPKATTKTTSKAPKAAKPAAASPAAPAAVSKTTKVLDKLKNNKGKIALGTGAALAGAAALTSDSSSPDDATAQQQSGNGSSGPNRASGSNPANPGSGSSSSKSPDKPSGTVKKKKMTLKPKADRNAPGSREARRRVLAGKDGVGPEGKKMRDKAATTLGVTTGKTIRK